MINVAVLAGGCSPEHDVSVRSGRQVLRNLDRRRWRAWSVLLDRQGSWWPSSGPLADGDSEFRRDGRPLRPGAAIEWLLEQAAVEVVFPVLHGPMGEDGTVQGMLEVHALPFVGSGCAASAMAMDKIRTRECLTFHGIPMPAAYLPATPLARADAREEARHIADTIGFPCFLKVDRSGSTLGVARADQPSDVTKFLRECRSMGRRFLAEAYVPGEEVTVPVLGNSGDELEPLPPVGIYPKDLYFTYDAKYTVGGSDETVPPRGWNAAQIAEVQELGRRCHSALQCDGMSRTDLIMGPEGARVLEVNTIPGLTETSLLPQAARAHGLSFTALVDRLLELALARRGAPA